MAAAFDQIKGSDGSVSRSAGLEEVLEGVSTHCACCGIATNDAADCACCEVVAAEELNLLLRFGE